MNDFTIFAVDDDEMTRAMIEGMLAPEYPLESFASAEACLARIPEARPGMLLLDIGLPGMDGYALCRQLKDDAATSDLPVVFVSAHDTLEARLAGFDAGGEDFIVKPFEPELLLRKVQVAERLGAAKRALREQVQNAEHMTDLALSSMGDSGVALQFMSKLVGCESEIDIADSLLQVLAYFRLAGAIEARVGDRSHVLSSNGDNLPLETAILGHVRSMDRIFEFQTRSVYNLDNVTLMVSNMPVADAELCGRIRDTLAIVTQGADGRLQALATAEARERSTQGLMSALDSLRRTVNGFAEVHERHRLTSSEIVFRVEQNLARSFVHLGLTEEQERLVEDLFRAGMTDLLSFLEQGGNVLQSSLGKLSDELTTISAQS